MAPSQYQLIVEVPVDDFALLERVQKDLSRSFKMDLSAKRGELRRGGVCVCRVDNLPMAKIQAELARGVGADFRILDPQGRTVGRGEGRRAGGPGARLDDTPRGFQAPTLPTVPGLPARTTASAPTQEARIVPKPKGPVTTSGIDLLPPDGDVAHIAPKPGQDLDALDADDLVMLDGTAEEKEKVPSRPLGLEQPTVSAAAFRAPTQDEELELDEDPNARTRPTPKAAPRPAPSAAPPPLESDAVIEDIPALDDLMPTATPPAAAPALPAMAPPPSRPAPVAREPRQTGRGHAAARARGPVGERVLFGGWFRARNRARIVVGFLVALGLGSIAPIVQSRSIVTSRILPEMQELSTARAYPALARLANLRTPEDIEESISGTKSRHGMTSFLIWLVGTGLVAFLWFRFV